MIHRFAIGQTDFGITTTASGGGAASVNISAGTTSISSNAFTFSNSNGVTFGIDTNAQITASVQTNYQSPGAYLTTAALSQDSSKYAGTGFTTATTAGTNVVGTLNNGGLSLGVPAYLTTAMQSNASTISNIKISAGLSSSNVSAVTFSNANGVSFGYDGTNVTATVATNYQSQGAYLTTAALSQDSSKYAGTGTSATNASITLNTAGLAISVAAGSNSSWTVSDAATSATVGRLAFTNSNGLTLSLSTSNNGNHTVIGSYTVPSTAGLISAIKISAGTLSSNRTDVTFADSNGVSWGLNTNGVVTATVATNYQSQGAYLTTAALSQDSSKYAGTGFTTTTTAGTAIVGTHNTAGLSMGVPAFLTTAMASNAATISNIKVSAGTLSNNLSAITFSDSNGISWGLNTNSVITASIATTYAGTGFTTATTAGTAIVGTLNTSGLSMGVPAFLTTAALSQDSSKYAGINSAITGGSMTVNTSGISVNIPIATLSYFANIDVIQSLTTTAPSGGQNLRMQPFILQQPCSIGFMRWLASFSAASASQTGTSVNTSFTMNYTFTNVVDFMTQGTGANSLSLQHLVSTQATWVFQTKVSAAGTGSQYTVTYNFTFPTQGTTSSYTTSYATSTGQYEFNTTILTAMTGPKYVDIPFASSLSAGNYWAVFGSSSAFASNTGPANLSSASIGMNSVVAVNYAIAHGFPGQATATSNVLMPGLGTFTSGAKLLSTASIPLASVGADAGFNGQVYFQFLRYA